MSREEATDLGTKHKNVPEETYNQAKYEENVTKLDGTTKGMAKYAD